MHFFALFWTKMKLFSGGLCSFCAIFVQQELPPGRAEGMQRNAEMKNLQDYGKREIFLTLSLRHPNQRFSQSSVSMR